MPIRLVCRSSLLYGVLRNTSMNRVTCEAPFLIGDGDGCPEAERGVVVDRVVHEGPVVDCLVPVVGEPVQQVVLEL